MFMQLNEMSQVTFKGEAFCCEEAIMTAEAFSESEKKELADHIEQFGEPHAIIAIYKRHFPHYFSKESK